MEQQALQSALDALRKQYGQLDWTYYEDFSKMGSQEKMYRWPAPEDEDIAIVVHQSRGMQESFHRHEFFYFNYTYRGEYDCLSSKYGDKIIIHEGELYAGQPYAGHALCVHDDQDTVIIGILIRREAFFRIFLPMLSENSRLFHFFLDPVTNSFSEEFIHFKLTDDGAVRGLLELIVVEYAQKRSDTQDILTHLVLAFLMQTMRQYTVLEQTAVPQKLSDKIIQYMLEHFDSASLKTIAAHFSYHPNYISALLHRETGKTFSRLLLEQRMERALVFLQRTDLPIHEIAARLGYSNSSNFYKAFREFYHTSPREYLGKPDNDIQKP